MEVSCVVPRSPVPAHIVDSPTLAPQGDSFIHSKRSFTDVYFSETQEVSSGSIELRKSITASKLRLDGIEDAHPLPKEPRSQLFRRLQWGFFSVYRRIFTVVSIVNVVAVIVVLSQLSNHISIATIRENASTAAAANLCVGTLMRNEHVVNGLFRVACSIPHSAPLAIRRQAAKVYSYGGVHSSCNIAGTMWFIAYYVLTTYSFCSNGSWQLGVATTSAIALLLLVLIVAFAHPWLRIRYHDVFEATHRFAGWTAIITFWVQAVLVASTHNERQSLGLVLVKTPTFWFLIIITCCIIYPWARLRRRNVVVEPLFNNAARLHFDYGIMQTGAVVRLTDAPLMETHAFATIANRPDQKLGYSTMVSNAGDWTRKIIQNPPDRLWVRGAPMLGVIRVSLLFRKVLVIATGSGIGPCLSFLQANPRCPVQVIWSAPNPIESWGIETTLTILRADPGALIVDTHKTGRPDLVALAYGLYMGTRCEAAVIISNPVVTKKVVFGLESRRIPIFGAIFDS